MSASFLKGVTAGILLLALMNWLHGRAFVENLGQGTTPRRRLLNDTASQQPKDPFVFDVVIVGAGAAGLSQGARLQRAGVSYVILEKDEPGSAWRNRYDRLHLHTTKQVSTLPFWDFPSDTPLYPSKDHVAAYQRAYAQFLNVRSHTEVTSARFNKSTKKWTVVASTADNATLTFTSSVLIVATGQEGAPKVPTLPGQDTFPGAILHSKDYKNGASFSGKDVLVVGYGNSGSEIALDLWEYGARPTVLIRSPINILPRFFTRVLSNLYPLARKLPAEELDRNQPLVYSLIFGDSLSKVNITLKESGVVSDISTLHRAPVQDLGTLELILKGDVPVVKYQVKNIRGKEVEFSNGERREYDAVVLATGFDNTLHSPFSRFLSSSITEKLPNKHGVVESGRETESQERLYFVGFNDYLGRLAEINLETEFITKDIKERKYV